MTEPCLKAPVGWRCSRGAGHPGPCSAEHESVRAVKNQRWAHNAKGGTYVILADQALLQTDVESLDMAPAIVYQGSDSRVWVRPAAEFYQRFTRID